MNFQVMANRPEEVAAERMLIATLCAPYNYEHLQRLVGELGESDFIHPLHRQTWAAMQVLVGHGSEINLLTLNKEFERKGQAMFSFVDLTELLASDDAGSPQILVGMLKESSTRRKIQNLASAVMARAGDEMEDLDTIVHDLLHGASNLSGEINDEDEFTADSIFTEYVDRGLPLSPLGKAIGCFGLEGVEDFIEIPVAEPMVIGARPGCGKTAMGIQVAIESVLRYPDMRPYFVSLELTKPKLLARFAAYLSSTDSKDWREGFYGAHKDKLRMNQMVLEKIKMSCPNQGTPWPKIEARIRRQVARNGVNLVVIDYFGYIGRKAIQNGSNAAYAYGEVMDGITALAKDLNIAIILLCQLKQPQDIAVAKRPHEGQFADSDRPYRDSNVVVMLWRDAQGNTKLYNPKNRDGVPGKEFDLAFNGASGQFRTVVRETKGPTDEDMEAYKDWQ